MKNSFEKILRGYKQFRQEYALGNQSVMRYLSDYGQKPKIMIVACCDSRVDPALILQCDPGDLFVVRNVANIVPPYEKDDAHHGTSAALEFGICVLNVSHLILLGHSQCGGIQTLMNAKKSSRNDFITNWVSIINTQNFTLKNSDDYAKLALNQSYQNCLNFPWIQKNIAEKKLIVHRWFFDIQTGKIFTYLAHDQRYVELADHLLIF